MLVYYGLSLNISDFGMNIYLTQLIFGLVEMPARTITLFTLNRSRKISQLAFLAVGGLACLLTIFVPRGTAGFTSSSVCFHNAPQVISWPFFALYFRPVGCQNGPGHDWEVWNYCLSIYYLCLFSRSVPHCYQVSQQIIFSRSNHVCLKNPVV